ncbi:hypothetical protein K474DRAFT_1303188 [Panus rudis PR-1116 ss-1]|nr:hypothetical protein K474DRAFT_1303188 [Panus rudis PR-1116 ss-1]
MSDPVNELFPLFVFLSLLLFAGLGWCMLSSCMGTSMRDSISAVWNSYTLGARSGAPTRQWHQRRNMDEFDYEMDYMEYRDRGRR